MIDPIDSLTFSLHANKGAYALLLGSGVSRAAQIPTGWEVVEDLIRRLAEIRGENCQPDPSAWFEETVGEAPSYSGLLKALARSPVERQQLMRRYFEPTEEEREGGIKAPTKAHRAIATLVASGHVRIILTTNFDRLTERALEEVGIVPTVVSSPDQVRGLPPLLQISCLIVKLHGDYLDSRIKNTPEELGRYDGVFNRLLDRILDEFGVIVVGWSAQWDRALCSAIERCRSHRFTTYWAHRGPITPEANQLIVRRRAQAIKIDDADSFFESLAGRIEALDRYDRPHPLSVRMAVESLKIYLVDPKHRIRLSDLISQETETVYDKLSSLGLNKIQAEEQFQLYDAILEKLVALLATGAAWSEPEHLDVWQKSLARMANPPQYSGWGDTILATYPALRLLYAAGVSAVRAKRFKILRELMDVPMQGRGDERHNLLLDTYEFYNVTGFDRILTTLRKTLREPLREELRADNDYYQNFDLAACLIALSFADQNQIAIHRVSNAALNLCSAILEPALLSAGFFGGSADRFLAAKNILISASRGFH